MMPPNEVEELFYLSKNLQRKEFQLPDFQYYYGRIPANGSKVNISYCGLEYKEQNPDGYEKSQFYEYFNRFVEKPMVAKIFPWLSIVNLEKGCSLTGLVTSLNFLPMLKLVRLKK